MTEFTLVVGNKNYSSWSLRPWLALRMAGVDFEEVVIPLYGPGSKQAILRHSPAGKVPILRDGDVTVWDSLAICEYAADVLAPRAGLWPADPAARARARSISAEMHAGFPALRQALANPPSPGSATRPQRELGLWTVAELAAAAAGPGERRAEVLRELSQRRGDQAVLALALAAAADDGALRALGRELLLASLTNRPDERFLLERRDRVVVGSACSGHGFKFAPVVGRTLAGLARDALAGR